MERDRRPGNISSNVFYARTFALAALLLIGALIYWILSPFLAPLAWACFIAFLLYPLHRRLVRVLRGRRNVSALLLTIATALILLGPLTALGATLAAQAANLLKRAEEFATQHNASNLQDLANIPVIGPSLDWVQNSVGVSLDQIEEWALQGTQNVLQFLASFSGKIVVGALGTVVFFALTMFLLFFIVRDGKQMLQTLRRLIPMREADKNRLFDDMAGVTYAVVYGNGLTSVIDGVIVGVSFAIVGLPSPVVFGVIAFVLTLLPMAGAPILWVPAAVWLAFQQRWFAAGVLVLSGIVIAVVDNFVMPHLISGRARVATLTVFLGVLGGASAFGAIGVIAGPLILALAIALIRFAPGEPEPERKSAATTKSRVDIGKAAEV